MRRWSTSVVVLGVGFASTLVITLGLVMLVVQDRVTSLAPSETPLATIGVGTVPSRTGGTLAVSGARDATFALDRDEYDVSINPDFERGFARVEFNEYRLLGDDGAIRFGTDPLVVEQIDYDGLTFYPEADACTVSPGELNPAIGVAGASLDCPALEDIRGGGTIALAGGVAFPADLLGLRGDVPPTGGRIQVGGRTLEFSDGRMLLQNARSDDTGRYALFLFGDDDASALGFERDPETAELFLTYLVIDEELFDIDDEACTVASEDRGQANPITTVQEWTIRCDELDLGSHGVVGIDATLVVDLIVAEDFETARR